MADPNRVQLSVNGQVTGPHTVDEIRALRSTGSISAEDHVWGDGMSDWVSVEAYLSDAPLSLGATEFIEPNVENGGAITNDEPTFARFIVDALSYPFRGDGFLILGLGTILFTGLNFLGQFSLYLTIAGRGYLLLMLQQVIPRCRASDRRVRCALVGGFCRPGAGRALLN